MKKHFAIAAAALAFGFTANAASAQTSTDGCGFEHPRDAKSLESSFVQAFVSCGNPGGNTPNGTTAGGVPSCNPPATFNEQQGAPANGWMWDERRGHGKVSFKASANHVVSPLNPPGETRDLKVKMSLRGVVDAAGPASGPGTLATLARATFRDRQGAPGPGDDVPMTVIDFPAPFPFTLTNGSATLTTSANALLNGIGQPGLPECSNIEVVSVSVDDENGNAFASMGTFLPE